jgi:hypothetical protein
MPKSSSPLATPSHRLPTPSRVATHPFRATTPRPLPPPAGNEQQWSDQNLKLESGNLPPIINVQARLNFVPQNIDKNILINDGDNLN